MKLYLASAHLGKDPTKLLSLLGDNRRVASMGNALDEVRGDSYIRYWRQAAEDDLDKLGLPYEHLDLRDYFAGQDLGAALQRFGLVWATGGNAFVLRRAMRHSGFDQAVQGLLRDGEIVYVVTSAGSVVAGPTLRGFERVDEPDVALPRYPDGVIWDGLGLVGFTIIPHVGSDDPEVASAIHGVVSAYADSRRPYRALRDEQVVVVEGDAATLG